MVKRSEKTFISFRFEAKQSKKTFISSRFEAKRKNRSETTNFWKRNKVRIRSINFALVGRTKFDAKRSKKVSVPNQCETADLVSLRFTLKEIFFCETGAP
jgi:hypothetical protein